MLSFFHMAFSPQVMRLWGETVSGEASAAARPAGFTPREENRKFLQFSYKHIDFFAVK